ncbi:pyridine nucleotide-disulfide oxidoreductase domain-containing protein 1-like [Tubulanus polymorphus]|uniref:pyridine nucleotide-disulfide oxidoreductase domain-containing protein 1-like n=1 Tax=Tubulanus polymorphus TaxID=672921 RepID=UPI003DA1F2C2
MMDAADQAGSEEAASKEDSCFDLIVVGGGIAGVTCAQSLSFLQTESRILLISASPLIKAVINYKQLTKVLEEFDVEEKPSSYLESNYPNVKVIHAVVTDLDSVGHKIYTDNDSVYRYRKLCLCAGGRPKIVVEDNPYVLGIRDTESVRTFQRKLTDARRVVIVGNGGIATELVYELENVEIVWAIKDESITATFIDVGAAEFFLASLNERKATARFRPIKREKYVVSGGETSANEDVKGSALGPDWHTGYELKGLSDEQRSVHVEYKVEVRRILTQSEFMCEENLRNFLVTSNPSDRTDWWPVYVELTNGKIYGCDFVVSATGVKPNRDPFAKSNNFTISADGGLMVDDKMRTSIADVYAAGDLCAPTWEPAKHWLQMKLWTQARQMGIYAGKCIDADLRGRIREMTLDFCFEIFTHVTQFFGYKVVLLGKFNAQDLGNDYHVLLRTTEGREYVKAVMHDGRMQGAILIGETDLEETFENLILNQMDLSRYGEDLLHPDIDIEDYFD